MEEKDLYSGELTGLAAASKKLAKDKKDGHVVQSGVFGASNGLTSYATRMKKV